MSDDDTAVTLVLNAEFWAFNQKLRVEKQMSPSDDGYGTYLVRSPEARSTPYILHVNPPGTVISHLLPADESQMVGLGSGTPSSSVVQQKIATAKIVHGGETRSAVLVLRERVEYILADVEPVLETLYGARDAAASLRVRMEVLRRALAGLMELHSEGIPHRAFQATNIGISSASESQTRLVDYGFRSDSHAERPAAEADVDDEMSNDISAFGELIERLIGPYHWDNREIPDQLTQLRTSSFEWISDYCTMVSAHALPSSRLLMDQLFLNGEETAKVTNARLNQARSYMTDFLVRVHSLTYAVSSEHVSVAEKQLRGFLKRFPETRFAVIPDLHCERILHRFLVDSFPHLADTRIQQKRTNSARKVNTAERPPGIDDVWRDKIHRTHFGVPMDLVHDKRMQEADSTGVALPGRDDFLRHVNDLSKVRETLLRNHHFLFATELAEYMTAPDDTVSVADVTALRRWGVLLAVPDHGRWMYPLFQLDPNLRLPSPLITEAALARPDSDEWGMLSWWSIPRTFADGASLAEGIHKKEAGSQVARALELLRP